MAAAVCCAEGVTRERVTGEPIRATLQCLGVRWQRAKQWITSPDAAYARKKKQRDRLIRLAASHPDWALGFGDEVWWSRIAQPHMASWADDGAPLRLAEQTVRRGDPGPKALA